MAVPDRVPPLLTTPAALCRRFAPGRPDPPLTKGRGGASSRHRAASCRRRRHVPRRPTGPFAGRAYLPDARRMRGLLVVFALLMSAVVGRLVQLQGRRRSGWRRSGCRRSSGRSPLPGRPRHAARPQRPRPRPLAAPADAVGRSPLRRRPAGDRRRPRPDPRPRRHRAHRPSRRRLSLHLPGPPGPRRGRRGRRRPRPAGRSTCSTSPPGSTRRATSAGRCSAASTSTAWAAPVSSCSTTPVLAGEPGEVVVERGPDGRTIPQGGRQIVHPSHPGEDLVLTIDRGDAARGRAGARRPHRADGCARRHRDHRRNPRTGEIYAMANMARPAGGGPAVPDGRQPGR